MSGSSHGWLGRAAAALVDERVLRAPERERHERRRLAQLGLVVAGGRERPRQAVRGEHEARRGAARLGDPLEGGRHELHQRLDEAGVVVERPQLVDLRRALADLGAGPCHVLEVLPAARVGAVRRGEERERVGDAVVGHLPQRVGEQRVPVAVSPVDRQRHAVAIQLLAQRRHERAALGADRAHAAEVLVVRGHLAQPLLGGTFLPRTTFARKGITSSIPSGPPKETRSIAS